MSQQPAIRWTVDDARALRQKDGNRRARLNRLIGNPLNLPVSIAMRAGAAAFGEAVHGTSLRKAARRMNRHMETGFQGYTPWKGDVVCAAYFKAGTNWVMHCCHQIASRGEAEFDHIQDVIAWPDAAQPRYWRDLFDSNAADAPTGLRVIKSHLPSTLVPITDDARYVVLTRDPVDCAASGYHYFAKLMFGPMTPPPDNWLQFFGSDAAICGPWHAFTASWWAKRTRENVLFLVFEDMKSDTRGTVARIADFLGVELTKEELDRVLERISFAAMKQINDKFYPVRQTIWTAGDGKIIRKGAVGDGGRLFSQGAIDAFRRTMTHGLRAAGSDFTGYGLDMA